MNDVVRWLFMEERRTAVTAILRWHGLSKQNFYVVRFACFAFGSK